jgi:hypothetical protein
MTPLYASPPPVAAPSGEAALRIALQDLVLVCAPYIYPKPDVGPDHAWSVLKRAQAALEASPIASEPKDAGYEYRMDAKTLSALEKSGFVLKAKDAGSGEGQLSQAEIVSRYTMELIAMGCPEEEANSIKRRVEVVLEGITRTSPSGAKPGEVEL